MPRAVRLMQHVQLQHARLMHVRMQSLRSTHAETCPLVMSDLSSNAGAVHMRAWRQPVTHLQLRKRVRVLLHKLLQLGPVATT